MTALRIHWAIKLASKPICVLLKEEEKYKKLSRRRNAGIYEQRIRTREFGDLRHGLVRQPASTAYHVNVVE